jgi:hypothetical protein
LETQVEATSLWNRITLTSVDLFNYCLSVEQDTYLLS